MLKPSFSGDTRGDWSEAFELVPSIQVAYVWHASVFTRDVLNGLERIGFLYPQQINLEQRARRADPYPLVVSARTLLVRAEEARSLVRHAGLGPGDRGHRTRLQKLCRTCNLRNVDKVCNLVGRVSFSPCSFSRS